MFHRDTNYSENVLLAQKDFLDRVHNPLASLLTNTEMTIQKSIVSQETLHVLDRTLILKFILRASSECKSLLVHVQTVSGII